MKRIVLVLLCAVCALSVSFAQDTKKKETVTFHVEGMDCQNCVKRIEKNIAFEKGVTDLRCDLKTKTAVVTYKADKTSQAKLAEAFDKIDMKATVTGKCAAKCAGKCEAKCDGKCQDKCDNKCSEKCAPKTVCCSNNGTSACKNKKN